MKLEMFGGPKQGGWSGHGEYDASTDPALEACPFCRETDIDVSNTHTPYYRAKCNTCGAQGPSNDLGDGWRRRLSRVAAENIHRSSFARAIDDWNDR